MTDTIDRRDVLGAAGLVAAAAVLGSEAAAQAPAGRMTVHILDLYLGHARERREGRAVHQAGRDPKAVEVSDDRSRRAPDHRADADGRSVYRRPLRDRVRPLGYFKGADKTLPANFFRKVTMEFEVIDAKMPHHIPLQCTPWTQACSVLPG